MKDIKRLNDVLDGDCEEDCSLLDESGKCTCDCLLGWDKCQTPVLCLFEGQVPSKTVHDVILHNFLPISVIGFIHTEEINPLSGLQGEVDVEAHEQRVLNLLNTGNVEGDDCDDCDSWEDGHNNGFCEACREACLGDCEGEDPENCGFHPDHQDNEPADIDNFGMPSCTTDKEPPKVYTNPFGHSWSKPVHMTDDGPPELPNEGDDQSFTIIQHDLQHIECQKLGLENAWADVATRCTFRTPGDEGGICALRFGQLCRFDKCKRI